MAATVVSLLEYQNTQSFSFSCAQPPASCLSSPSIHHQPNMTTNPIPSTNSNSTGFRIISNRERRKEFDSAVKEVIRQRKVASQMQEIVRQHQQEQKRNSSKAHRRGTASSNNSNSSDDYLKTLQKLRDEMQPKQVVGPGRRSSDGDVADQHPRRPGLERRSSLPSIHTDRTSSQDVGGGMKAVSSAGNLKALAAQSTTTVSSKMPSIPAYQPKVKICPKDEDRQSATSYTEESSEFQLYRTFRTSNVDVDRPQAATESGSSFRLPLKAHHRSSSDRMQPNPLGFNLEDLVPTRRASLTKPSSLYDVDERGGDENDLLTFKPEESEADEVSVSSCVGTPLIPLREESFTSVGLAKEPSSSAMNDVGKNICPRTAMLKAQGKLHSGATGQTTSTTSIISFGDSMGDNQQSIQVIDESVEVRGRQRGRDVLPAGEKTPQLTGNEASGASSVATSQSKKNNRINQLRKSIANSLSGGAKGGEVARPPPGFMDRKGSTRSMASAISAITLENEGKKSQEEETSSKSATSTGSKRWKFKLGRRSRTEGKPAKKDDSSSRPLAQVIVTSEGGSISSRRLLMGKSERGSISNISNNSGRSNRSSRYSDDMSNSSRLSGFYDNNSHARAMSGILSRSHSGRSVLSSSLAPVKEPAGDVGTTQSPQDTKSGVNDESSVCSNNSYSSFYLDATHNHPLVHIRPSQLFPDSPGWQCDECLVEMFDTTKLAYVSTNQNYLVCENCFSGTKMLIDGPVEAA